MIFLIEPTTEKICVLIGENINNWPLASEEQILSYKLSELKKEKIQAAKASRDFLLAGSKTYEISLEGVSCKFSLKNSDLPNLIGREYSLNSNEDTAPWGTVEGEEIQLNKQAFLSLIRHINSNDADVHSLYRQKVKEIDSVVLENEYFDEKGKEISALEYLQKIKTVLI